MKKQTLQILAIFTGCAGLLWGQAADRPAGRPADPTRPDSVTTPARVGAMPMDDDARELIEGLIKVSTEEIQLSRLATERATNPQVRSFAEEMVSAHTASRDELQSLMSTVGQSPARSDADRPADREWANKDKDDFDEDYMEKMVDLHEENIDLLEDAAESDQSQIRAYAERHLPTVKSHLERAKALAEAVD